MYSADYHRAPQPAQPLHREPDILSRDTVENYNYVTFLRLIEEMLVLVVRWSVCFFVFFCLVVCVCVSFVFFCFLNEIKYLFYFTANESNGL